MNRRKLAALTAAAVLAVAVTAVPDAAANVTVTSHFAYVTSAANTVGDSAYIDNAATNGNPDSVLFATPNWDPNGLCNCAFLTAPMGVWYDGDKQQWAVFTEDDSAMPAGEAFNVLAVPKNRLDSSVFTVTAHAHNIHGSSLRLSNPNLNGHPGAFIQVTQNFDPGGVGGAFNPHYVGVKYNVSAHRWGIFNEDGVAMPAGVSFNVLVGNTQSNGGDLKLLTATESHRALNQMFISNPQTTGNPNNVTFETQVWNPGGTRGGGVSNSAPTGVFYSGTEDREAVFNQDLSESPLGAGYNLLIYSS